MLNSKENRIKGLLNLKPKATKLDQEMVEFSTIDTGGTTMLVCRPSLSSVNLNNWIKLNQQLVEDYLLKHGNILFTGFPLNSVDDFRQTVASIGRSPMEYTQRSSPRTEIAENIYTSTDHPADQYINMHNELSYASAWPMKIMFFCLEPAAQGGETPIADSREVLRLLSWETREKFAKKGVMYIRTLLEGFGLSWKQVFQTGDRRIAEKACRASEMEFEWKEGEKLVIKWIRPAIRKHPQTGEQVWFNHGFFFNELALDPLIRSSLVAEELPFNTFYGDGSAIEPEVIAEIKKAFEQSIRTFSWQKGDLLLLDNMLFAHGRFPYSGNRKILVAMCDPNN